MAVPSRTSWKGYLKLSLVSVPVKAFTCNDSSSEVRLNQLHKDCNSRVKYQKVCPEHGELKSDGIVSGYEHQKDQYVVVEPDDLNKLRTNSERSVGIDGFIPVDAIDSRFYAGKAHYLMPDGIAGERPYQLLRDGMQKNEVCAIAQVVMSGREQLVVVRAIDRMLVMFGLHYPAKVRKIEDYQDGIEEIEFKPEEIALTDTLIGASKIAEFDFSTYTDTYVQKLKKLIEMKVAGEEIVQAPDHEEPKILNLMDALKKSVAEAQTKQAVGADADPDTAAGDDDSAATDSASAKKLAPSAGKKKRSKKAQGE
ncbi:MAG: DNA end-binding protein Ku [Planctomycetota bacterium]|jgi:DNA end-binding protein Ku